MNTTHNQKGGQSPWGQIQTIRPLSHDLEFVTTASHGGYWLGPERWQGLKETFPTFEPYAGMPWLEEDCDGTLAVLLWPDLFRGVQVWSSVRLCLDCAEGSHPLEVGHRWLAAGGKRATAVKLKADAWEAANHDTWLVGGGCSTPDGRWTSEWRQVGTRERRLLTTKDMPIERQMTTAQLDAAMVASRANRCTCTVCGRRFTPGYGEYHRCPECLGSQHSQAEKEGAR